MVFFDGLPLPGKLIETAVVPRLVHMLLHLVCGLPSLLSAIVPLSWATSHQCAMWRRQLSLDVPSATSVRNNQIDSRVC